MRTLLTATLILIAFGPAATAQDAKRPDAYFPLTPGATWKYRATITAGGPAQTAEQTVTVEKRELNGKPVFVAGDTAYAPRDEGVHVVGVVRNGQVAPMEEPYLMVPTEPKLGDRWTFRDATGVTSATCLGVEKVKVGAGEFDAAKVYLITASGAGGAERREVYHWFAAGVGPVKGTVTETKIGPDGQPAVREIALELLSYELPKDPAPKPVEAAAPAALVAEGEALARKGDHRAALTKYDAAVARDPALAKAHAYRALSLISLRQFDEADRAIGRALTIDPKEYTHHEIAGHLKLAQGRIPEGKALYDRAAALSPANAGAVYTDLAAVLGARKDDKLNADIVAALEKAAKADPPSPDALFALGQTYVSAGRPEGRAYLERYLQVAATLPEAKRDEQKLRLARQLIRAVDAVKAP